jgi:hypothetical protein
MIEIRQAEDDLSGHCLLDPFGHTSGLLCRRHAQNFMRRRSGVKTCTELGERTGGDFATIEILSESEDVVFAKKAVFKFGSVVIVAMNEASSIASCFGARASTLFRIAHRRLAEKRLYSRLNWLALS